MILRLLSGKLIVSGPARSRPARSVLSAPEEDGALTHRLCEAARALLEAFLQLGEGWDEETFIDALMPMSVQCGDEELELVAAAIVTSEEAEVAWVEPLVAHFVLEGDALGDVSLLFAYG